MSQLKDDKNTFESLFWKYNGRVYNFIFSLLRNATLAEDITQSVFLSLWEARDRLDDTQNVESYLFTIARNMVYRHTEKMVLAYRYEEYIKAENSEIDHSEEEKIDHESDINLILDLVDQLPESRRQIFLLKLHKGKKNKEIAEELSISEKTVETQLRRSVMFLKDKLKNSTLFSFILTL